MKTWKKLADICLFPPIPVLILLLPLSVGLLAYGFSGSEAPVGISYLSYVLSAYTLTISCLRIPQLLALWRQLRQQNKLARRWREDPHLRLNASLYTSLIWNTAYAVFHLILGLRHRSFWFESLAAYYGLLAFMRFFLLHQTRKKQSDFEPLAEWRSFRICGVVFLLLNAALSVMVFFMVYWNRSFVHHEITTIALATYTFVSLSSAIIGFVKYRRYNRPVYTAAKIIGLAAACVSMLTLTSTMLTTFGGDSDLHLRKYMLASLGSTVSLCLILLSVVMILQSTKNLKSTER